MKLTLNYVDIQRYYKVGIYTINYTPFETDPSWVGFLNILYKDASLKSTQLKPSFNW